MVLAIFLLGYPKTTGHCADAREDDLDLGARIQPASEGAFFKDPEWHQWCSSIIKDSRGIYHLFYSRWPKSTTFEGWLTHSEIARATAPDIRGPYTYQETVLKARPGGELLSFHNPKIKEFGGKYYLYYTASRREGRDYAEGDLVGIAAGAGSHPGWTALRFSQRIYLSVSDRIEGDWTAAARPLIEPSPPIAGVTVNPDTERMENGEYVLVVKGDMADVEPRRLIQALATSATPGGPFTMRQKPMFDEIGTEDVSIWKSASNHRYYAIFHAHHGDFIGLLTSTNGLDWEKARFYEVCKKTIPMADGTVLRPDRMERPLVFHEDGRLSVLSFGVKLADGACIAILPLSN